MENSVEMSIPDFFLDSMFETSETRGGKLTTDMKDLNVGEQLDKKPKFRIHQKNSILGEKHWETSKLCLGSMGNPPAILGQLSHYFNARD